MSKVWKERFYIFVELKAGALFYKCDRRGWHRLADYFDDVALWAYLRWQQVHSK